MSVKAGVLLIVLGVLVFVWGFALPETVTTTGQSCVNIGFGQSCGTVTASEKNTFRDVMMVGGAIIGIIGIYVMDNGSSKEDN